MKSSAFNIKHPEASISNVKINMSEFYISQILACNNLMQTLEIAKGQAGLPGFQSFFGGGGGRSGTFEGDTLLKIIICIKSRTLLGNIGGGGATPPPNKKNPGLQEALICLIKKIY